MFYLYRVTISKCYIYIYIYIYIIYTSKSCLSLHSMISFSVTIFTVGVLLLTSMFGQYEV